MYAESPLSSTITPLKGETIKRYDISHLVTNDEGSQRSLRKAEKMSDYANTRCIEYVKGEYCGRKSRCSKMHYKQSNYRLLKPAANVLEGSSSR